MPKLELYRWGFDINLRSHTVTSLGFSLLFYALFKSVGSALTCFLVGILVDLDHFFDYIKDNGLKVNIAHFYQYFDEGKHEKLYLIFHAYEYLIPIAFLFLVTDNNLMIIAVVIGFAQHLLFDQITNPMKPMAYFLIYRIKNGFSKESLLRDEYL